jgi:hypothetical protein
VEKDLSGIRPENLTNRELVHYAWLVGPFGWENQPLIKELIARFEALLDDGK